MKKLTTASSYSNFFQLKLLTKVKANAKLDMDFRHVVCSSYSYCFITSSPVHNGSTVHYLFIVLFTALALRPSSTHNDWPFSGRCSDTALLPVEFETDNMSAGDEGLRTAARVAGGVFVWVRRQPLAPQFDFWGRQQSNTGFHSFILINSMLVK